MTTTTKAKRGRPKKEPNPSEPTTTTTKEPTTTAEFSSNEEETAKEKLRELDTESKTAAEPKQETRGRKRKEELKEIEEAKVFSSNVSKLGTYSFGLVIARMFPEQPLSVEEESALNESVEAVALKYVSVVGKYKEEAGLAAALTFIILPRYMLSREKKKEAEKNIDVETKTD